MAEIRETNQASGARRGSIFYIYLLGAVVIAGAVAYLLLIRPKSASAPSRDSAASPSASQSWQSGKVAIAGNYADPDIIKLPDGRYRMYYAAEPEIPNFNGQVYAAVSSDGVNWQPEGEVREQTVFPDVEVLPDGRYRMYFQHQMAIKSAISSDGLHWTDEMGTRIGLDSGLDEVGAPATLRLLDDTYLMVYSGTIDNRRYNDQVPNNKTANLFYATSSDGLTWQKKGLAVDAGNSELLGWSDGPALADFTADGGGIRLYFWSYKGIYYVTYKDGKFSQTPVLDFAPSALPDRAFPENPPGDPTLIKIGSSRFMYYDIHQKGIYFTRQ